MSTNLHPDFQSVTTDLGQLIVEPNCHELLRQKH